MRLLFSRHAESEANVLRAFFNRGSTHPLTSNGRLQAADLAHRMSAEGVTHIYSSPLQRALQTAEIIGEALDLPVTIEPLLREYDVGWLEGHSYADTFEEYERVETAWSLGMLDERIVGGESAREITSRVNSVLQALLVNRLQSDTILLVSHGGTLRAALPNILTGLTAAAANRYLGHCEVAAADLIGRELIAKTWGDLSVNGSGGLLS